MSKEEKQFQYWAEKSAEGVLERYPDEKIYTCAAGISPSGKLHFGNFRDLITVYAVAKELEKMGKKTRIIYSFDNYDRFRKVPSNVPESFEEHIGKPLTGVPDPEGEKTSYAIRFQEELEEATKRMGMNVEYISQTEKFTSGVYAEGIKKAMQNREDIAKILLSFMSDKSKQARNLDEAKYIAEYYPLTIYSEFSGKDNTEVLSYDGEYTVTYKCHDTDKESTINFKEKPIVKLPWKVDWPMRWEYENVTYEPSGADHTAPQGSYYVGVEIAKKLYSNIPCYDSYNFVGIQGQGSKMSGSKGNAVTPNELMQIYEKSLLKWIYLRKNPHQTFSLAFNTELYRQYDEFDRAAIALNKNELPESEKRQLEVSYDETGEDVPEKPFPFKQAVALGQIVQWDAKKVQEILYSLEQQYDIATIERRLPLAKAWLEIYNPDEMISLCESTNSDYVQSMSDDSKQKIQALKEKLEEDLTGMKELEATVYAIPKDESLSQKENAPLQRAFFKDVYNLLIGQDKGPRLSTFLWAVDRKAVLRLLDI